MARRMGHKQLETERARVMRNFAIYFQTWNHRNRRLAIEATITAVLVASDKPLGIYHISKAASAQLDWIPRSEVHSAIERMIASNRVSVVEYHGRTYPLYELPNAHPSTAPTARPS